MCRLVSMLSQWLFISLCGLKSICTVFILSLMLGETSSSYRTQFMMTLANETATWEVDTNAPRSVWRRVIPHSIAAALSTRLQLAINSSRSGSPDPRARRWEQERQRNLVGGRWFSAEAAAAARNELCGKSLDGLPAWNPHRSRWPVSLPARTTIDETSFDD